MQDYRVKLGQKTIIINASNAEEACRAAHHIANRYDYDDSDIRIKQIPTREALIETLVQPYFSATGRQLA